MDLTSEGYYQEKLAKAKVAMKPIVKALHERRDANMQSIPMISLIREMQADRADSTRIKNILADGADYGCPEYFRQYQSYTKNDATTNDLWEATKRIINKHVDYQMSLGNDRSLRM